jgi:hypothetical protein
VRIAAFLGRLREISEQLDPLQRWYRILSEALQRYLKGRILDPPLRLQLAWTTRIGCLSRRDWLAFSCQLPDLG